MCLQTYTVIQEKFVNNNVRTYENLYIQKIKLRNILETKYSRFTVVLVRICFHNCHEIFI